MFRYVLLAGLIDCWSGGSVAVDDKHFEVYRLTLEATSSEQSLILPSNYSMPFKCRLQITSASNEDIQLIINSIAFPINNSGCRSYVIFDRHDPPYKNDMCNSTDINSRYEAREFLLFMGANTAWSGVGLNISFATTGATTLPVHVPLGTVSPSSTSNTNVISPVTHHKIPKYGASIPQALQSSAPVDTTWCGKTFNVKDDLYINKTDNLSSNCTFYVKSTNPEHELCVTLCVVSYNSTPGSKAEEGCTYLNYTDKDLRCRVNSGYPARFRGNVTYTTGKFDDTAMTCKITRLVVKRIDSNATSTLKDTSCISETDKCPGIDSNATSTLKNTTSISETGQCLGIDSNATSTLKNTTSTFETDKSPESLSAGDIVGIVVGVVLTIIGVIIAVIVYRRWRFVKKRRECAACCSRRSGNIGCINWFRQLGTHTSGRCSGARHSGVAGMPEWHVASPWH